MSNVARRISNDELGYNQWYFLSEPYSNLNTWLSDHFEIRHSLINIRHSFQ
jgi:hypothetical protein